ncbi:MAG: NUDIX domain-containing protein [Caldilineaceae bacterium]|nr:NUDIX domain-containing protein [Caldilineaceae bacterium]
MADMPLPAQMLGKVTAFVTRGRGEMQELLILRHPFGGLQLPAGTIEPGESPAAAVLREVDEETGLTEVTIAALLDAVDERAHQSACYVLRRTALYARPDAGSFDWITLPRALTLRHERHAGDFIQVSYAEWDDEVQRNYRTYQFTGWARADDLVACRRRFFFHLHTTASTPDQPWTAHSDHHTFTLFWQPLADLPRLHAYQQDWLTRYAGLLAQPGE